jgi:predicted alpha/beta hydrolase
MSDSHSAAPSPPPLLPVSGEDGHQAILALFPTAAQAVPGLLWLPAMGVPARKYRHFAQALAALGWPVALHEWRGQDSSNRRAARGCNWGYAQLLADIAASRAALEKYDPGRRWVIGGHSLGGQLAVLALALAPQDYAGYALAGSGQPWWRTFPGWHKGMLLVAIAWFRAVSAVCGYFPGERAGFGGREARGVMQDWARSAASGNYAAAGLDVDLEAALRRLRQPALALRLASDFYAPAASLQHLLGKLPQMDITQSLLADAEFAGGRAGHFDWMRDPAPVASRIDAWMKALR